MLPWLHRSESVAYKKPVENENSSAQPCLSQGHITRSLSLCRSRTEIDRNEQGNEPSSSRPEKKKSSTRGRTTRKDKREVKFQTLTENITKLQEICNLEETLNTLNQQKSQVGLLQNQAIQTEVSGAQARPLMYLSDLASAIAAKPNSALNSKDLLAGLLFNAGSQVIFKTFEDRFRHPDAVAVAELGRLRSLPQVSNQPKDICEFANRVTSIVASLCALANPNYLYNPEVLMCCVQKLTPELKYRWYDYDFQQKEDPGLINFSKFMDREAGLCARYGY